MTVPDPDRLADADYDTARAGADEDAIVRFTPPGTDPAVLPLDPAPFTGAPTRIPVLAACVVLAVAATAGTVYGLGVAGDELLVWPAGLALAPAAVFLLGLWVLPFALLGSDRQWAPLRRAWPAIGGTAGAPGRLHRVWIVAAEEGGGIASAVVWLRLDDGHDVLACGRVDRERGVPHLLITEVPHEGDRAWCWRAPTGQTLIQIRRRRTGET